MAPPQGFQAASILPRPSTTGSSGSHRNASGGQPPIPRDTVPTVEAANSADNNTEAPAVPAKIKPINRPVASKNAIVYNAVQVSLSQPYSLLPRSLLAKRRNPVLGAIKNVGIEIGDITAEHLF